MDQLVADARKWQIVPEGLTREKAVEALAELVVHLAIQEHPVQSVSANP